MGAAFRYFDKDLPQPSESKLATLTSLHKAFQSAEKKGHSRARFETQTSFMRRSTQELEGREVRRNSQMYGSTSKKSFQLPQVSSSNGPKRKFRLQAVRRVPSKSRLSPKASNPLAETMADYYQQFPSLAAKYRSTSRHKRSNRSIEVRRSGKALKHSLRFRRIHP